LIWSFSLAIVSFVGGSDLPGALSSESSDNSCQDDICIEKELYLDGSVQAAVPNSELKLLDWNYFEVDKRSAWKTCSPNVPANMMGDSFKSCKDAGSSVDGVEDDNLDLSCQLLKRGIFTPEGELDKANIAGKFSALGNTDTLIQECYDWEVDSDDSKILKLVDDWEWYGGSAVTVTDYHMDYWTWGSTSTPNYLGPTTTTPRSVSKNNGGKKSERAGQILKSARKKVANKKKNQKKKKGQTSEKEEKQ